jgi:hypothetical protein
MTEKSDLRLDDAIDFYEISGPEGEYAKTVCLKCSQVHKCYPEEFDSLFLYNLDGTPCNHSDTSHVHYVAKMRAWNCCREGKEPLDGFPERPEELIDVEIEEV